LTSQDRFCPARKEKKGEGNRWEKKKRQPVIYRYYERTWVHLEIYWPIWSRSDSLLHNQNTTMASLVSTGCLVAVRLIANTARIREIKTVIDKCK